MESKVPANFIWPKEFLVEAHDELQAPIVDLDGFLKGHDDATQHASNLIREACLNHGFFQVINHGVDSSLIKDTYDSLDNFFKLPKERKVSATKKPGSSFGYSGAHAERFSSKLPWKETLSFPYHDTTSEHVVTNYFNSNFGEDLEQAGVVFQKYCEGLKELGVKLTELLAISLGVDRLHYRELFDNGCSIMRLNYYPLCEEPNLALGTGPHYDPTSITILHQDDVGGLDVFVDNKWQKVRPHPHAFVVNIGDTFSALTNGRYKSCLHRAVVNDSKERRSMAFFLCPKDDMVLRPPKEIVLQDGSQKYPDFTWTQLLEFTQKHYRADEATLPHFARWLLSSKTVE
ncbi:hypothetical protein RIF29_18911 [Crotalaria pallida]|uniref:Fe2OG dioxygenase domain-containing protein n=1 Tax=Crotalaria pallida TaxID=3830 RepID=A0AAN9F0B1_CROPI